MPRAPVTTPRKKPQQPRSQETVEALLEATARVLVSTGYDRASTNRIAEAAGVSVGSLYQYFPSKEALVAALLERHSTRIRELVHAEIMGAACLPLEAAVRKVVTAVFEAHRLEPKLHRMLHEQVPKVGRLGRLLDDIKELEGVLVSFMKLRRDELAPADLEVAAHVIVTATEATIHSAVLYGQEGLAPEAIKEALVEMIIRYLKLP